MTEEQLLTLDALIQYGRVGAAAVYLQVSPSTVVARIAALENDLGARLFRHGTGTGLTASGNACWPHIQAALTALAAVRTSVACHPFGKGTLTLAATPILASRWLPRILQSWPQAQAQDVRIAVRHSPDIVRQVQSGAVAMGFAFDASGEDRRLRRQVLGADPLIGVVPRTWALPTSPDAVLGLHPFIMCMSEQPMWVKLRQALYVGHRFPRRPWIEVEDLEGARALIESGAGWGILPWTLAAEDLRLGRLRQLAVLPWKLPVRNCEVLWMERDGVADLVEDKTLERWQQGFQQLQATH